MRRITSVSFALIVSVCIAAQPARADQFPPGTYKINTGTLAWGEGCQPISMVHGKLTAHCVNYFGAVELTSLADADKCVGGTRDIMDVNGTLRCVLSFQKAWSYDADVISISSDVKTRAGETRVIRIDQPRVDIPVDKFNGPGARRVAFDVGDVVTIDDAGGCVQTGGSGSTWKSYDYPQGSGYESYYSGELWIPNVTGGGLTRIAGLLHHHYTVGPSSGPLASANRFLYLGYQDDNYTDNGYYAHDDGNNNQCANVGPAWVVVKIFHPAKPAVGSSAPPVWAPPAKLPFDLTWNENVAGDNNGLPLNPEWAYQIDQQPLQTMRPDFQEYCGSAISGGDTIDYAALAKRCTGDAPSDDLFQGWDWFGALCPGNPLSGHLNWQIVTYTGQLEWREYSGGWPQDGDYNFGLETPQQGYGETDSSDSGYPGIGMEYDSGETIDHFNTGWWNTFANASDDTRANMVDGQDAIVTGVMGIDGVHGGYSEIHPVYAMAVETSEKASSGGLDQTWAFFIRNMGDEGECSSYIHEWPGLNGKYSIQFPAPTYANKVRLNDAASDVNAVFWSPPAPTGPSIAFDGAWTYLEFHIPMANIYAPAFGITGNAMYGQIGLHYSFTSWGKSAMRKVRSHRPYERKEAPDLDWRRVESRIANVNERRAFDSDLRAIRFTDVVQPRSMRISVDPTIHVRAPASKPLKGSRVRDLRVTSTTRAAYVKALRGLLLKYRPFIAPVTFHQPLLVKPIPKASPGT